MKFDDYIRHQMQCWPTIMPIRARALDRIFLAFGAGLVWHKGVVRSVYEEQDDPTSGQRRLAELEQKRDERFAEIREDLEGYPELIEKRLESWSVFFEPEIQNIRRIVEHPEEMASGHNCVVGRGLHQLSKDCQAPIQCVPDDVQPDWLSAAREACALVLACPFGEPADVKRNKRIVRKIIKDLDKRFGKAELPDVSYVTWEELKPEPKPEPVKDLDPKAVAQVKAMWEAAMDKRKDAS